MKQQHVKFIIDAVNFNFLLMLILPGSLYLAKLWAKRKEKCVCETQGPQPDPLASHLASQGHCRFHMMVNTDFISPVLDPRNIHTKYEHCTLSRVQVRLCRLMYKQTETQTYTTICLWSFDQLGQSKNCCTNPKLY